MKNKTRNFGEKTDFRNTTNSPLNPVQLNKGEDTLVTLFTCSQISIVIVWKVTDRCEFECDECAEMKS